MCEWHKKINENRIRDVENILQQFSDCCDTIEPTPTTKGCTATEHAAGSSNVSKQIFPFFTLCMSWSKKLLELRWAHLFCIFIHKLFVYGMKFGWQKKDLVRLEVIGCSYFFLTQFVAALVMLPKVFQYINIWTLLPMKQLNTPKISSKFWPISLHDIFFCFGNLATVIFLFQN